MQDFVKELKNYDNESANIIYQNARLYWGNQPIVAAPAYIGISAVSYTHLTLPTKRIV